MDEQDEIDATSDMAKNMTRAKWEKENEKCEDCLLWLRPICCQARNLNREGECHLLPDQQRFIDAMIRGVFNCGHCRNGEPVFTDRGYAPIIHCLSFDSKWGSGYFCSAWQERKEGEDG